MDIFMDLCSSHKQTRHKYIKSESINNEELVHISLPRQQFVAEVAICHKIDSSVTVIRHKKCKSSVLAIILLKAIQD